MKKLNEKSSKWVELGIISEEQAQLIIEYEGKHGSYPWVLYSFLVLGVLVILTGFISLIGANWKVIPPSVKLISHFIIFLGLICGVYQMHLKKRELLFEVGICLLSIYSLASIGLISQIYHTGGEFYQAALFWSVINFGFLFLVRKSFFIYLWSNMFFGSLLFLCWEHYAFQELYRRNVLPLLLALPFLSVAFVFMFRRLIGEGAGTFAFRKMTFWMGLIGVIASESRIGHLWQKHYSVYSYAIAYLLILLTLIFLKRDHLYSQRQKKII